jgi:hypothetical protein
MASLIYGTDYHIQNGYNNWSGGWLDTRGEGCESNLLCVSTATSNERAGFSGTWKILSATGKSTGDPVMVNDIIYLQNQYPADPDVLGGWLDTRGEECESNLLCVSTAKVTNRFSGSGSWRILTDAGGGEVQLGSVVHLMNGYNEWQGGWLDTRGGGCESNLLCVSTSANWNREWEALRGGSAVCKGNQSRPLEDWRGVDPAHSNG